MKKHNYFRLFATCIPVRGAAESAIYDLDRARIMPIPNLLYEILSLTPNLTVEEIKARHLHQFDEGIDLYFNYFIENELGFLTEHTECFPLLDFEWDSPHKITNAILEIDADASNDLADILRQLNDLGCRDVQIRHTEFIALSELDVYLGALQTSRIKSIELFLVFDTRYPVDMLQNLLKTHPRLSRIIIHSVSKDNLAAFSSENTSLRISFTEKVVNGDTPEIVSQDRFAISMNTFFEALNHNAGLNRKVCIDKQGNIKNHFYQDEVFGNIYSHKIKDVVALPAFQEKWNIGNDRIKKCKDCQYRFACVSNSDLTQQPDGEWEKNSACSYDPYAHAWLGQQASKQIDPAENASKVYAA